MEAHQQGGNNYLDLQCTALVVQQGTFARGERGTFARGERGTFARGERAHNLAGDQGKNNG